MPAIKDPCWIMSYSEGGTHYWTLRLAEDAVEDSLIRSREEACYTVTALGGAHVHVTGPGSEGLATWCFIQVA